MLELDLLERDAGFFQRFDGCIEGTGMPRHRDRDIAKLRQARDRGVLAHHDGASACRGVEADDLAGAELLNALDRAPLANRVDVEGTSLELGFLPSLGEVLDPAGDALR